MALGQLQNVGCRFSEAIARIGPDEKSFTGTDAASSHAKFLYLNGRDQFRRKEYEVEKKRGGKDKKRRDRGTMKLPFKTDRSY